MKSTEDLKTVELTHEQRMKIRTAVEERTEKAGRCLLWTGAHSTSRKSKRVTPVIWMDDKAQALRRLAFVAYGGTLLEGQPVSTSCGKDSCLCQAHLKRTTHSAYQKGKKRSLSTKIRMATAKQAHSPLDWEKVREIRGSDLGPHELAQKHGVCTDTIMKVVRHQSWKEYNGFFSGLVRP